MVVDATGPGTDAPIPWLFLGQDYPAARRWERELGAGFERVEIGHALASAADALRGPFVEWVDALSRLYENDPDWWFTNVSERNTLVSPLFLHACYLEVARRALSGDRGPRLLVAESRGLVDALRRLSAACGVSAVSQGPRWKWIERLTWAVRLVLVWGFFLVSGFRRRRAARATRRGARRRPPFLAHHPAVLIDTFLHESNLAPDGIFRDRYFPYLHEWLGARGFHTYVLATPAGIRTPIAEVYAWMRSSATEFLIPEDWLTLGDYASALRCALKGLRYPRTAAPLAGMDIRPLVEEERWLQAVSRRPLEACLMRRLPVRLKAAGLAPDLILNWFENQMLDKALVLGCTEAFPGVRHHGIQNTPLFPNLLNMFPTAVECHAGVVPDKIVCSGPLHQQILTIQSRSQVPVVVGCGLRYGYLWNQSTRADHRIHADRAGVLVTLPNPLAQGLALLDLVLPVSLERPDMTWYVKPHPDYSIEALRRAAGPRRLDHVVLIEGALSEWLEEADLVVSACTGAALEAVAAGMPVVLVGSPTALDFNPLAWFDDVVDTPCFTHDEIIRRIDELIHIDDAARSRLRERGVRVLHACFSPVTDEHLRRFIE